MGHRGKIHRGTVRHHGRMSGSREPRSPHGLAQEPVEIDDLALAHAQARNRAEAGDLTGSRTLMEDALAVAEQRLGRDNPRLAPLMVDLATIARNLGNLTEARSQLRRAYAIIVASAGPEHATSLSIEGRLAAISYRLGEPTEAYDWHLADVGLRVLGADHPAVRGARQRLAKAPSAPQPAPAPMPTPGSVTIGLEDDEDDFDDRPGLAPTIAGPAPRDPPTYTVPGASETDPRYFPTDYPGVYQRQAGEEPPGGGRPVARARAADRAPVPPPGQRRRRCAGRVAGRGDPRRGRRDRHADLQPGPTVSSRPAAPPTATVPPTTAPSARPRPPVPRPTSRSRMKAGRSR